MTHRIYLAGASGVIGRVLGPLLVRAGHEVFGLTRSPQKQDALRAVGVHPVLVDVFDAAALLRSVGEVKPDIVIHQLTDLPSGLNPAEMAIAIGRNARIRDEGTRNLVNAARAAGVGRLVAQSIAWAYAVGTTPYAETAPLDVNAEGLRAVSVGGVVALERHILESPPLVGTVLRYGALYGHGTGADSPRDGAASVHVDAAAQAALLAVERPVSGIFNIAEPDGPVATTRAGEQLGWTAGFRLA